MGQRQVAQEDFAQNFRRRFYELPGATVKAKITIDYFTVEIYHPARKRKNNKKGWVVSYTGPVSSDQFSALMYQISLIGSDRRR